MESLGVWNMRRISRLTAAELRGLYRRYKRQIRYYGMERCYNKQGGVVLKPHGTRSHVEMLGVAADWAIARGGGQNEVTQQCNAVFKEAVKPLTSMPGFSDQEDADEGTDAEFWLKVVSTPVQKALDLLRSAASATGQSLGYVQSFIPDAVLPYHCKKDAVRAARGLDSALKELSALPRGRATKYYGLPPDATEYYVHGKSSDGTDERYRVEKVTVGPWYASKVHYVCVDLLAYLRCHAGLRERTTALLHMLQGRAIVWSKERSVSWVDLAEFMLPTVTLAVVLANDDLPYCLRSCEVRHALEVCSDIAAGKAPRTATWRWWDLLTFDHDVKAAITSWWADWALPRPDLPSKAFRESFL